MGGKKSDDFRERENLYRLIVSQLYNDGYSGIAEVLMHLVRATPPCPPSDRLLKIVRLGLETALDKKENDVMTSEISTVPNGIDLDFDYEADAESLDPKISSHEKRHISWHRGACCTGAFSNDGQLAATGGKDCRIKIFDIDCILTNTPINAASTSTQRYEKNPEIYDICDHTEEVTCLEFHPTEQILVSGSKDYTIKFFDYSKLSVNHAFRTIHETATIRSLCLHPSGKFLLVGAEHPVLRVYDVKTSQCFVSSDVSDQHKGSITMVRYSPNVNIYASSSNDGDIKIWDTVSNQCFQTFEGAHEGRPVHSVQFSRNGKYILSSSEDSSVKLWDTVMGRCIMDYGAVYSLNNLNNSCPAVFNHTEDYIILSYEGYLLTYNSRTAHLQQHRFSDHRSIVHSVQHSPKQPVFFTCNQDFGARFYVRR